MGSRHETSMVVKINEMRCFIPMNITVRILRLSFSVTCFDFSLHKGFVNIHTRNPGPGLGQAQNGTGLNQLMGIQPIQI
jgi:hypothetical protein